jgi:hypothetical protein
LDGQPQESTKDKGCDEIDGQGPLRRLKTEEGHLNQPLILQNENHNYDRYH